jgi:hypothetical protein
MYNKILWKNWEFPVLFLLLAVTLIRLYIREGFFCIGKKTSRAVTVHSGISFSWKPKMLKFLFKGKIHKKAAIKKSGEKSMRADVHFGA